MAARDVAAHQLARIHNATVGIVAEDGYKALKVRDVVRYAEVSTRAFYELFSSKEDCFLHTYDLISRRASSSIIDAQASESDWRKRPRLAVEEFVRGLGHRPQDARLALVEAYAAGDPVLEHAWKTEQFFGEMLAAAFAQSPAGLVLPPLIIEAIVGGFIHVARDRLLADATAQLESESEELAEWSLVLADPLACELAALDRQPLGPATSGETPLAPAADGYSPSAKPTDRALILEATAELAAAKGYARLTAPRVRATARVSRRKFEAHFDGVEDCYLNALDLYAGEALARAARARAAARSEAGGVYRATAALCGQINGDPFLTRVCLDDDFPPSARGANSRQLLKAAVADLLGDGVPATSPVAREVTEGALWSLFHHHVVRDRDSHRAISASLSYLILAPAMGAAAALAAIRGEQEAVA